MRSDTSCRGTGRCNSKLLPRAAQMIHHFFAVRTNGMPAVPVFLEQLMCD